MNILILSCGTGGGHNTAGLAVADELKRRGHNVCFEDAFGLVGNAAAKIVNNTYIKTVQYVPKAFGAVYSLSETVSKQVPGNSPVYWANSKCTHALKKYLQKHHFDAVVMTHLFAAHMLTALKRRGLKVPKSYLVATDYTCHPFLEEADCDHVVIPAKELALDFIQRGVPADRLLPFGIPVKCEFAAATTKAEACKALGLSAEPSYILLSGGSIGASSMTASIKELLRFLHQSPAFHLIVICGSNERLYEKLRQNYAGHKQLHIIGKTSQMHAFMQACDIFITKPGGLSTTEAAVCGVPLILMPPIPGCETYNIHFFEDHRMCLAVQDPEKDLLTALEALQQADTAASMRMAQQRIINSRATKDLCDHIERTAPEA